MVVSLFNAERLGYGRDFAIVLNGKKYTGTLYEDCRITEVYKKTVHAYGMRHPDDAWDEPISVAPGYPLVNFFGTFVTKNPLPIKEETDIESWEEAN
jgi:hypothetical protein